MVNLLWSKNLAIIINLLLFLKNHVYAKKSNDDKIQMSMELHKMKEKILLLDSKIKKLEILFSAKCTCPSINSTSCSACSANSKCLKVNDSVSCKCNEGYIGDGFVCENDSDMDGIPDKQDNCEKVHNPLQIDSDKDGVGDSCDNCPHNYNPEQKNDDSCIISTLKRTTDSDFDGINDDVDNCKSSYNPNQSDIDQDGIGDVCDICPNNYNPEQKPNSLGKCDDRDDDGIIDNFDNCPLLMNYDQIDTDSDMIGDACDEDADNDSILNNLDNCPFQYNPNQENSDGDYFGDKCDQFPLIHSEDSRNLEAGCSKLNSNVHIDLNSFEPINIDPFGDVQPESIWDIPDKNTVIQVQQNDPGILISRKIFQSFNLKAQVMIKQTNDDDIFGFVFGYNDSPQMYVLTWKASTQTYWEQYPMKVVAEIGITIKKIKANGFGQELRNLIWSSDSYGDKSKVLWKSNKRWLSFTLYDFEITHNVALNDIKIVIWSNSTLLERIHIKDDTFNQGRIGLLTFSQENVLFKINELRC